MKTVYRKFGWSGLVTLLTLTIMSSSLFAATIQLPQGQEVKVRFAAGMNISSAYLTKDNPLVIYLAESIEVGGKVIVEAGAMGIAKVIEAQPAGKVGKAGFIKIAFVEMETKGDYQAIDGSKIKLSGEIENKGKGKKTLSLLFILGLLISGTNGEISSADIYTAQVAEPIILQSK